MRVSYARTCHLWNTSMWRLSKLRFTCHSLPADTKREASRKLTAQLLRDSLTRWWWKEETTVRSNTLSEQSSRLWNSFTWSLERILYKFLSMHSPPVVPEKTPPESEAVVWLEDRQSTCPHLEEWTSPSTSWQEVPESHRSDPWKLFLSAWLRRSSPLQRYILTLVSLFFIGIRQWCQQLCC